MLVLLGKEWGGEEELAFHNGREHEIPRVHLSKSDERELGNGYTRAQYIHQAGEYLWSFAEDEWEIGRESFVSPLCSVHLERVKRSSRETLFRHVSNDLPRLRGIVSARTKRSVSIPKIFPSLLRNQEKPYLSHLIRFDHFEQFSQK